VETANTLSVGEGWRRGLRAGEGSGRDGGRNSRKRKTPRRETRPNASRRVDGPRGVERREELEGDRTNVPAAHASNPEVA